MAVATTGIKADGTWTRTVRFRMPNGRSLSDLSEIFVLPRGAPWTTRQEWEPAEVRYLARRTLRLGDTVSHDLHDDLAYRRLRRLLGIAVDRALHEEFGERITRAERLAAARQWVTVILKTSQGDGESNSGPLGLTDMTWAPLLFSAWLPGKLVATNGEWDEVTGEVFWGLYPEAAASEDVVLTATCDLRPTTEPTTPSTQR